MRNSQRPHFSYLINAALSLRLILIKFMIKSAIHPAISFYLVSASIRRFSNLVTNTNDWTACSTSFVSPSPKTLTPSITFLELTSNNAAYKSGLRCFSAKHFISLSVFNFAISNDMLFELEMTYYLSSVKFCFDLDLWSRDPDPVTIAAGA